MGKGRLTKKAIWLLSAVLAGVVIIIPYAKSPDSTRYIALTGFLVAIVALIRLLKLAPEIWNELSEPITPTKAQAKTSKMIWTISFVIFLASLTFLILEIGNIDNTVGGSRMFWMSFGTGLFVGILVTVAISYRYSHLKSDKDRRLDIFVATPLAFALFAAALVSYWNHSNADENVINRRFYVKEKGSSAKNTEFYLFIITEYGEERLTVPKDIWQNAAVNGTINLETRCGGLGFPFILFE